LLNLIFKELCFSRASSAQAGHYTRPASFGKAFTAFFEKNLKHRTGAESRPKKNGNYLLF